MIPLIVLAGIIFIIVIVFRSSQLAAWLLVYFITDPGGLAGKYFTKALFGGIYYIDIFFLSTFVLLFIGNYKIKDFFKNRLARNIFYILLVFSLYKIFVWGLIVPEHDLNYCFRYTLVRERDAIYGFLFIIPVYLFAMKDLRTFLNIIIILGFTILSFSILSMLFGLDIMPTSTLERYKGSGIIRHFLGGYGLLNFLIPAGIIVFIGKFKVKHRNLLFYGSILAVLSIIVSLTKGLYLSLVGSVIATVYIATKSLKIPGTKSIRRAILFGVILLLVMSFTFPKYSDYAQAAFKDIYTLATEGQTSGGGTSRLWQIPALTYEIKRHPFFGTGMGSERLSKKFDINQFDATDFSLLAHVMQYGIVGILIYLIYYFRVYRLIKLIYLRFKLMEKRKIIKEFKYELIFSIASVAYFVGYFTSLHNVFIELTRGVTRIEMTIYTGILLACLERIRIKVASNAKKLV